MSVAALVILMAAVVAVSAMSRHRGDRHTASRGSWMLWAFGLPFLIATGAALLLPGLSRVAPPSARTRAVSAMIAVDRVESAPPDEPATPGARISHAVSDGHDDSDHSHPVDMTTRHDGDADSLVPAEFRPWVAFGALAVLLGLAYLFLDAPRHRRYAFGLRIGYVTLFIGLCICIWQLGPLNSN